MRDAGAMSDPSQPGAPEVPADIERVVDALLETLGSLVDITSGLNDDQAALATPCPGWTVRDQVAHVAGLESRMLGRPGYDDHLVPDGLAHVRNAVGRVMEIDVDARRPLPLADVLAELAEVTVARRAQLQGVGLTPDTLVNSPFGDRPARSALPLRVFDCWAHEQDVRDALGAPGGMSGAAAQVSMARACAGLATVAASAGLTPDQRVDLVVTGAHAFRTSVGTGDLPIVTLTIEAANFTRLCCGRSSADPSKVTIDGDQAVGAAFVANLAITP